jgi:hypothetical protein
MDGAAVGFHNFAAQAQPQARADGGAAGLIAGFAVTVKALKHTLIHA